MWWSNYLNIHTIIPLFSIFTFLYKIIDIQEIHDYSSDLIIKFKQKRYSFTYKVIKEDIYSNKLLLAYTLLPNKYWIPDNYMIETT